MNKFTNNIKNNKSDLKNVYSAKKDAHVNVVNLPNDINVDIKIVAIKLVAAEQEILFLKRKLDITNDVIDDLVSYVNSLPTVVTNLHDLKTLPFNVDNYINTYKGCNCNKDW